MKKLVVSLLCVVLGAMSASAISPHYKGYIETYAGYDLPVDVETGGATFGLSTSHGVELIKGLFLGAGLDVSCITYKIANSSYSSSDYLYYYNPDVEYNVCAAGFFEARYNFLRNKKVSPFVGTRFGGGYNGWAESSAFYFSPAVGCTFNFTERFGLDLSLGYSLYTGNKTENEYYSYGHYNYTLELVENRNVHNITFRLGLHF